ncbi:MAG: hypothetical protein WCO60_01630 [Verrucomicrobiota bacterium]
MMEFGNSHFPDSKGGDGGTVSRERVYAFLGLLSHDIRNDLNAIDLMSCYLQELSSEEAVIAELSQLRSAVSYSAKRMVAISRALLPAEAELLSYSLLELAEDFVGHLHKVCPEIVERVKPEMVRPDCEVEVDVELFFEAMTELVQNAVAFSDEKEPVFVRVRACEAGGLWEVRQGWSGDSLRAEQWGREPFVSTRRGRYGIGLFHARKALEAQNAELEFQHDIQAAVLTTVVRLKRGSLR